MTDKRDSTMAASAVIEADCDCCDVLPLKKRRKLQAAYESGRRQGALMKLLPEIARALEVVSEDDASDSEDESVHEQCAKLAVKKAATPVPSSQLSAGLKPLPAPARLGASFKNGLITARNFCPAGKPLARPPRLFLKHNESTIALREIDSTLL